MKIPWLLLQLSDSALPTGGFAHSGGLEAVAQLGEAREPGSLRRWLRDGLWQAGNTALPLLSEAHRDPGALAMLDERAEKFLANHVARRASRVQGRAFLDTCWRIFPDALGPLRARVRAEGLQAHHAPLFGAVLRALEVERAAAQQLFLSLSLRGLLLAAVRLGLAGTHESQRLQHQLSPLLDEVLEACAALPAPAIAQTAPLLDLLGSMQDRLYSRLFQS